MSEWERSGSLTKEEHQAIYGPGPVPSLRDGTEWQDCPYCEAGVSTSNLGPVMIQGRCCVCAGTGRVLVTEAVKGMDNAT